MSERLALRCPDDPDNPVALPESGRFSIGSAADRCDLVLSQQGVGAIHCIIARTKSGGWAVQDMGTEFGTLLDGKRVEVARLQAGQTLLVASVSLEVLALTTADSPAPDRGASPQPGYSPAPEAAPSQVSGSQPAATPGSPPPATTGKSSGGFLEIPGYSIQSTLGRGGMGAVFLARQDRLQRDVALKILSPRLAADTDFVRQFHREAQAAAAFNHPNVVTVYDVGEASGTHYLAMEYMDGESLEELLGREGRVGWKHVAELLLGAARGLVYAESCGIVHRDIKPSNLMLNSDGTVKIADLGLAHRVDDESSDGRIFGTPHFMPPEQIRGETADRRSDIYSLGATGYRLLSGYTPFEGESTRAILRAVLTEEFEPLSAHISGVPTQLTSLIERMISRFPEGRPQSAESVVSLLESLLSGASAPAAPARGGRKPTAKKSPAGLIFGAVLVFGAFFAWRSWNATPSTPNSATEPTPDPIEEPTLDPTGLEDPVQPDPESATTRPGDTSHEPDDDVAQKLFESEAENILLRLRSSELSLADRQAALLSLAQEYNGTTSAALAREEAAEVAKVILMETEAEAASASRREAVLLALRAAADLESSPPRPGDALRTMASVSNQELLVDDESFETQRATLRADVCVRALTQAQAQLDEAKAMLADADAGPVRDLLQDLGIRLNLPELALGDRPEGYEDLRRLRSEAAELLRNMDSHRADISTAMVKSDALTIAGVCHTSEEFLRSLSDLRPAYAAGILDALIPTLQTPESRSSITNLAADLHAAATALTALSSNYDSWRRSSISDPRPRRGNAEVVALGPSGVDIQGDAAPERIEWSAFASQPEDLHQLFFRRLSRPWSEEEERGIAALLRHAAVQRTLRELAAVIDDPSDLRERDVEKILKAYEPAARWASGTAQTDLLEQEIAAARSLTQGIRLAASEQWAAATTTLRDAETNYADTLLLRLFSDGSAAPAEPETPAENDPADETPSSEGTPNPGELDPSGPEFPSPPDREGA